MDCVWCVNFYDLFDEYAEDGKFMELAYKMKAFEKNSVILLYYLIVIIASRPSLFRTALF